jgi:hypothetical protein
MKETGILFTPENHRAILNKTKWQTRRVMNPQPYFENNGQLWWKWSKYRGCSCVEPIGSVSDEWFDHCPQGRVGDKLYVKEGVIVTAPAWTAITGKPDGTLLGYYMDGRRVENAWEKRLTAMFMAKRYARTWLEITDVRVERIQDISEEDAIAEGIQRQALPDLKGNHFHWGDKTKDRCKTAVEAYRGLWDSINKKHPFSSNPWVWVLEFKQIK